MPATSASGGGGAPARSVIDNGPMAGRTLHDALDAWGARLLGGSRPTAGGDFPLLIKYLDARENLSVQVHPSPAYAAAHAGAHLKTESWFVLDAAPGAKIYKGVRPGVTREHLARAVAAGGLEELLHAVEASPGECHTLPSGTVHALGAGILVAEVQTPSDTTYRLFDWGRQGRALHVREALECAEPGPAPTAARAGASGGRLAETPHFAIDMLRLAAGASAPLSGGCAVLMVLSGFGRIRSGVADLDASPGATVLVPAANAASAIVLAVNGPLQCLLITMRS